jgi:hypothetical protein
MSAEAKETGSIYPLPGINRLICASVRQQESFSTL